MIKRGLNSIIIVFSLILVSYFALAQSSAPEESFDANLGFSWLVSQSQNGKYGDMKTTAIAAVTLKDAGVLSHADQALQYIKSKQDSDDDCWPDGNCNPLDTAFALWALNEFGEKTSSGEEWLRSSLTTALKNNWWLQVITNENGTCTISYPDNGVVAEETIQVSAGTFPTCSATTSNTFFDVNRCLQKKNVLINNPSASLDINCRGLDPSTIIALVFNSGSEFTLVEQATAERYVVTVNNGCFGDSAGGSCSRDTSLYGNWLFSELESVINTDAWLRANYDNLRAFDNALMFLASRESEQLFLDDLIRLQRNDGSFNKDTRDTALAILALQKGGSTDALADAIEFLKEKQSSDGSWEGSTFKTSLALYSAFTTANVAIGPVTGGGGSGSPICGDGVCTRDETESSCPVDCRVTAGICVPPDGRCDAEFGENSQNCAEDCTCGDGVCDSVERASGLCAEDCGSASASAFCGNDIAEGSEECDGFDDSFCPGVCQFDCTCPVEEKSGSLAWLWILIIILLIGGGSFFWYSKQSHGGKKKGNKRPEFRPFTSQLESKPGRAAPRMQYSRPKSNQRASKIDDELERSIKEAKKLMKKL